MGTFRALPVKWAAFAAVLLGATAVGAGPAFAQGDSGSLQQSSQSPAPMMGTPFVGSELRLAQTGTGGVKYCPDENQDPRFVMEWLSNGVPLPADRQGEVLKLLPEDRGNRISFNVQTCGSDIKHRSVETPPIAASTRANGWTGRGNFELLGRNADGDLVLYPRTYEPEWVRFMEFDRGISFDGSWDEPRVVGTGWNIFDVVFSPVTSTVTGTTTSWGGAAQET